MDRAMPGEASIGLTFSLLALGEFCLVSSTLDSLASSIGDASKLVAGLAAVGDVAVVEAVTESTGTVPA